MTVDGQDASYDAQLVWAGLATYPGLPATAFPAGTTADGVPVGLQVMTDYRDDMSAIAIADLLHGVLQ
jgi:amidase